MKVHFVTIVLDGMPWIERHMPVFNQLGLEWDWTIVEGVAEPKHCTAWCKKIPPRLSQDGTHEYLMFIHQQAHVKVIWQPSWPGKVAMFNCALAGMKEPGILWEIDADEIWSPKQINTIAERLSNDPDHNCADFYCRYFVGPSIIVQRIPGTWTNDFGIMWRRVWKFAPGMRFEKHEPPVIRGVPRRPITQPETEAIGCVFDHYAYVTEEQVRFKEDYYGYAGAVAGWRRLQHNTQWPARLKEFLPWVKDGSMAEQMNV